MKRKLLPVFSMAMLLFSSTFLYAYPEGQLYWMVDEYPEHFSLYNTTDEHYGGENAVDYACIQNPGIGAYYDSKIEAYTVSEKTGRCRYTHPLIGTPVLGNIYTAYLYCNGEKRASDVEACEPPAPPFSIEHNQGPPCPVE